MAATIKTVREAIAARIHEVQPDAVVIPRWIHGIEDGTNLGMLRAASGLINGWMVTRIGFGRDKHGDILDDVWRFRVAFFYQADTGDDATNSEDVFDNHLLAVQNNLSGSEMLGLDGEDFLLKHNELQGVATGTRYYGEEYCHVADCQLDVNLNAFRIEDEATP